MNNNNNNNNNTILNNNNKNKIIKVSIRSKGEVIKEFSRNYPSILENYINKDDYSNLIKRLNGYDGVYNKKAIIACSIILIIGIVCCTLGGLSNTILNQNNDDGKDKNGNGYDSIGDTPSKVIASQIIFFSIGGLFLVNSIVFLIFIYKIPFKNIKTIKKTLTKFNEKYLSRKIEFSLESENNDYFMKITIPSNPIPYIEQKGRFSEKTSLLKQKDKEKQSSGKKFKKVLIFDPHQNDDEVEFSVSSENNNNNNNNNNSDDNSNSYYNSL